MGGWVGGWVGPSYLQQSVEVWVEAGEGRAEVSCCDDPSFLPDEVGDPLHHGLGGWMGGWVGGWVG